jgi:(p)ppGpp synthase/HD superfamily hydrolase
MLETVLEEPMNDTSRYSRRVDEAFALVAEAFRAKVRKRTAIPYLTHLMQVAVWVWENGGDEEQAVAALLHDYLEDVDGATAEDVAARFGDRVARLVLALSDTTERPKPPWEARKRRYVEHLKDEAAEVKLVSACDKIHNASRILEDFRREGDRVFERFTASKEQTLMYYRAVTHALGQGWDHPLVARLKGVVEEIHREAGVEAPADWSFR